MRKVTFVLVGLSIVFMQSMTALALQTGPATLLSDRNYWTQFDWANFEKSTLFTSYKWQPDTTKGGPDMYEVKVDGELAGLKGKSVLRRNKSTNLDLVVFEFGKIDDISARNILKWLTDRFGSDYIDSTSIFTFGSKLTTGFFSYQWTLGKTVVYYAYDNSSGKDSNDATVVFWDIKKAPLISPPIKMECNYKITIEGTQIDRHDFFVIEDKPSEAIVKDENSRVLSIYRAEVSKDTVKMYFDNKKAAKHIVYISRLTGRMSGTGTLDGKATRLEGECKKAAMSPLF